MALALSKRLLHAQRLIPVLQHIGADAFGQLQAIVERHELDLLSFATAVDHARKHERAEDRLIDAAMFLFQPLQAAAVGQPRSSPWSPLPSRPKTSANAARPSSHLPRGFFDFVHRLIVANRVDDGLLEIIEDDVELFALENQNFLCHLHGGPPSGRDIFRT